VNVIRRFKIDRFNDFALELPPGAHVLRVGMVGAALHMWVRLDTNEKPLKRRRFRVRTADQDLFDPPIPNVPYGGLWFVTSYLGVDDVPEFVFEEI
jgi:hypothetical protein